MKKMLLLCTAAMTALFGWAAAPTQEQVTTVAQSLVEETLQGILPDRAVKTAEWVALEDGLGVWAVQLAPTGHLVLADSTKYRPLIAFSEHDFVAPEKDTPHYASLLAAAQRVAAAEAAEGEDNAAWTVNPYAASLLATTGTPDANFITAQPIDTTSWYQFNALAWYTPGTAPNGCVATAQSQAMHGLQWPVYPERFFETNLSYTDSSSNTTTETYRFTPYSKFDYSKMANAYEDLVDNTANNHQVARLALMNDIISKMDFKHNVSTTTVPPATVTPWMTNLDKRTRTGVGVAFTTDDKAAIKTAMEAGFPVVCNTTTHAVMASGYATIGDVPYVRINYGYNNSETAWYSLDDNNVLTFAITNPTKAVQCDPLPAITSASPTITWYIPKCYAGDYTTDVTGFSVKAVPVTAEAATWTCGQDDFAAGAVAGNTRFITTSKDGVVVNMNQSGYDYPFIYYTLDPLFIPTADSKWNTTYSANGVSGGKVTLQVLPLGGAWENVETVATSDIVDATAEISLADYAGKPCKLRYFINSLNTSSETFKATAISVTATQFVDKNSSTTVTGDLTPDGKDVLSSFSRQFSDLIAGEDYVFAVTPTFSDSTTGATGYCYTRIADGSTYVEESFATFEVTSPSTEAQSNANMQIADGFFRYCTYNGTSYIRVNAGEKVKTLQVYSSHLTAFPDDAFTVTSCNNGIFDIKVDNTKIPESPRVNDRVNLSLVATTEAGTISSHELSLAFDNSKAVAESEPAAPEVDPGEDPVEPETPSATTTPVPGDWTELALPDEKVPEAKASFMGWMKNAGAAGSADGAVNVLTTKLSAVKHGDVWPGTNGDPQYCGTGATAEGGEGYWSGSSITLLGRTGVGGMSALIVPVSGQIPHGTVIEKLRVKATIRGSYNDGASKTVAGNCAVAIGHATYDADTAKAYTYTATASAAGNGGNGTDKQIEATLTFNNAITWNESGENPDMIVLSVSTPQATAGNVYIVEIDSVEYFTEKPALATPVLLLDFGQATAIDDSNTEWTTLTGMSGKPDSPQGASATYSHTYDSTVLGGGYSLTHSFTGAGRCYDNGTWTDTFAEGGFISPDKAQIYTTALAEMKATLGLINDIPLGVYGDSSYTAQAGYRTQKFDFTGLNAEKYYVLYFIGGLSNSDGDRYPGFQLTTYNTAVTPVLSWARHTDIAYTTVDDPSAQINGDANTGAIIVRMHNVKPDANGNLSITVNSRKSPTNAIAIAESDLIEDLAPVSHTRELNDATEAWETPLSEWTGSKLPKPVDAVTLNVTENGGALTVDSTVAVNQLTVSGDKALTVTGSGSMTVGTSTAINASTDVSGITASLGAVTIAKDTTLTVGALSSAASYAADSTSEVVVKADSTYDNTRDGAIKNLTIVDSTLTSTYVSGGTGIASGRTITIDGQKAELLINTGDGTGYSNGTDSKIIAKNGGKLVYASRDTLKTAIELIGGTIQINDNAATSERALDFFNDNDAVADISVFAADGATEADPTKSYITALGTDDNRKLSLRQGSVEFNVAANATLDVNGYFANVGGTASKFLKTGAGVMTLLGDDASTFSTSVDIDAGTIKLCGASTLGSGTINVDGTLVYNTSAAATPANTFTGSGTITADGCTLDLAKDADIDGFSGTFAVANGGTLILPAGKEGAITVAEGATLKLVLNAEQLADKYESAATGAGTIAFVKVDGDGYADVTEGVSGGSYYNPERYYPTWTPISDDSSWTDKSLWTFLREDAVPTSGDVVIDASKAEFDVTAEISKHEDETPPAFTSIDVKGNLSHVTSVIIGNADIYKNELTITIHGRVMLNRLILDNSHGLITVNKTNGVLLSDVTFSTNDATAPEIGVWLDPATERGEASSLAYGHRNDILWSTNEGYYQSMMLYPTADAKFPIFAGLLPGENTAILNRDTWMNIASGNYSLIAGGNSNTTENKANNITGDIWIEMAGGMASYLIGGNWKDALTDTNAKASITGDITVVVRDGARIDGSIFGGSSTGMGHGTQLTGDTHVIVKNIQQSGTGAAKNQDALKINYIGGGDVYVSGVSPESTITGNTKVTIDLTSLVGTFSQNLVGGSTALQDGTGRDKPSFTITGNSAIEITAPNAVTFGSDVITGGSYIDGTGSMAVGGNSSITLNGGTYKTVVAGSTALGGGTATDNSVTMTLQSGVFAGATLLPYDGSVTVTNGSTMVIDGNIDLSGASIGSENARFTTVVINAGDTLTIDKSTNVYATAIEVNGTLVADGCTIPANVTITGNGQITGTAAINGNLTFAEGTTLDLAETTLTVSGAVTATGLSVEAPVATNYGPVLTAGSVTASNCTTTLPGAIVVAANTALCIVERPSLKKDDTEVLNEIVAAAIAKAAANVEVYSGVKIPANISNESLAAAELFQNVVAVDKEANVAVDYDFGIESITVQNLNGVAAVAVSDGKPDTLTGDYVVITATVLSDVASADYADGTAIKLYKDDAKDPLTSVAVITEETPGRVRLAVSYSQLVLGQNDVSKTFKFTVKATNEQ